jgi:hypothetical protein
VHRYAISYTRLQLPPYNHYYLRRYVSNLAQVLNVTSLHLCIASSSVDASMESAAFAERLEESFTSLTQPYRYTSYEISSSLRPTTMIFGCPLPDELDGASIGQRTVLKAFEIILSSAAKKHPQSLYQAICDAHKQRGDEIKIVKYSFVSACNFRSCHFCIVGTPIGSTMGPVSSKWWSGSCCSPGQSTNWWSSSGEFSLLFAVRNH